MSESARLLSRNGPFFNASEGSRVKSIDIPISLFLCCALCLLVYPMVLAPADRPEGPAVPWHPHVETQCWTVCFYESNFMGLYEFQFVLQ